MKMHFDFAGEFLLKRFEGEEIVAEDEAVIKKVVLLSRVAPHLVQPLSLVFQQHERSSLGRFSFPIHVNSSFCFVEIISCQPRPRLRSGH